MEPLLLAEHREEKGWTMADLARLAGVGAATVHAIEHGRPPVNPTKRKIAEALGVPIRAVAWPSAEEWTEQRRANDGR